MTLEEIQRRLEVLRENSVVGVTPILEHDKAYMDFSMAVVDYIAERLGSKE